MRLASLAFGLAALLALSGCRRPQPSTYTYTAQITTGIGHTIVINGKEEPVLFSDTSAPIARWSLCHLRSEVVHAAGNQFTITGTIEKHVPKPPSKPPVRLSNGETAVFADPEAHILFKITDWKLKAPFHEYHFGSDIDITKPFPLKLRHTLHREDFTSSEDFDPKQPGFDPSAYLQK
jgi:hypothetical protein